MQTSNKKLKKYAGLLNDAAPKGEFLAYINKQEAQLLKNNGGLGLLTNFGVPSYRGAGGYQGGSTGSSSSSSSSSSSGSSSSSSGGGGGGGGGGRDYSSVPASTPTTSTPSYSGGGGGQDMSSVPASTPSVGNGNDGRLDYITGEYLDLTLTPEQKEQFSDYREGVSEAISPSTFVCARSEIKIDRIIGYLFLFWKSVQQQNNKKTPIP